MIDGLLMLLGGYLLGTRGGQKPLFGPPQRPEQVPFPQNQPVPPAPRTGPVVLPEITITPSPGVLPAGTAPLPVSAAVPKKKAVEVFRVAPSHHGKSVAEMQRQWPAGWVPSHPPSGAEIAKAQSLLPGWKKGGLFWDTSSPGTSGVRAYVMREH